MKVLVRTFAILVSQLVIVPAVTAQAVPASLQGVVLQSGGSDPIVGAKVVLSKGTVNANRPDQTPSPIATASTDDKGEFRFDDLLGGPYSVTVTNNGFVASDSA